MTPRGQDPAADPIQALGADESEWRAWAGWDALPEFPLPTAGRAVVITAHPDAEVLGFGGSLSLLAASGLDLTAITVIDGERSHPGSRVETPESFAPIYAQVTRAALAKLGAADADIIRLHVPDTEVVRHEDRPARGGKRCMAHSLVVGVNVPRPGSGAEGRPRHHFRECCGDTLPALSGVDVALGAPWGRPGAVGGISPHPPAAHRAGP